MTKQETFDQVVKGIIAQGKPAMVPHGVTRTCQYLTDDGLKCAAGQLIPDGQYKDGMNQEGMVGEETVVGQVLSELGHDLGLVGQLQNAHDTAAFRDHEPFMEAFLTKVRTIAAAHGLDDTVARETP